MNSANIRIAPQRAVATSSILDRLLDDKPRDAVEGQQASLIDVTAFKAAARISLKLSLTPYLQ